MKTIYREDLEAIRALIDAPGKWSKGADARTAPHGQSVPVSNSEARCFCVAGAGTRAGVCAELEDYVALALALGVSRHERLSEWNDRQQHWTVMARFAAAIGRAPRRPA